MPALVGLPHPRKLHALLCACPSAAARAQATLAFLCDATGAAAGFLFLRLGSGLVLAASSRGTEPASELVELALRAFHQQLQLPPDDKRTRDIEIKALAAAEETPLWKCGGQPFERRMLSTHRGTGWVPVGIAVLEAGEGGSLRPVRNAHVEAICDALLDAGDVSESSVEPELRSD